MPPPRKLPRSRHPLLDVRIEAGPRLRRLLRREGAALNVWVSVGQAPAQQVLGAQAAAPDALPAPPHSPPPPTGRPSIGDAFGWGEHAPVTNDTDADARGLADISRRVIHHVRGHGERDPINGTALTLGLGHTEFLALRDVLGDDLIGPVRLPLPPDVPVDMACHKMLSLLWASRRDDAPLTRAVAASVACASKEDHHLWVDLGLSGRDQVNQLIKGHFPALYRSNVNHVGWKKYLLKQIGETVRGA